MRKGIEPKSRSQFVFTGPFEFDGWRNNFVLESMTNVLQIKLREDLGGTYLHSPWLPCSRPAR